MKFKRVFPSVFMSLCILLQLNLGFGTQKKKKYGVLDSAVILFTIEQNTWSLQML